MRFGRWKVASSLKNPSATSPSESTRAWTGAKRSGQLGKFESELSKASNRDTALSRRPFEADSQMQTF